MNSFDHRLFIGTRSSGGDVILEPEARRRHLYVVGQTGTGKSTLLLNLMAQDLAGGEGLALLDPHGDLARDVLKYVPNRRLNDLVYINPYDYERPIGFNPLSDVPPDLRPLVAAEVVSAFQHVWPDSWGPRLDYILTNAVRTLLDVPGGTLLMLPRLLTDEAFRSMTVAQHVADPVVRSFWINEYAGYTEAHRTEAISPIQNKIGKALMVPALRNMLAQPRSTVTFNRLMNEGAIVVCDLSKGRLGESTAHLLGALIVTAFAQAALSRATMPEHSRRAFHLYADEFQSFATQSFALILSEARKYGLTLTLAHQYLEQLPIELRSAVFGNAGSLVSFRAGAEDAAILARQIDLGRPEALLDLSNGEGWARLLHDGTPTSPMRVRFFAKPRPLRLDAARLTATSARRFGRPRREIEARINRFLGA